VESSSKKGEKWGWGGPVNASPKRGSTCVRTDTGGGREKKHGEKSRYNAAIKLRSLNKTPSSWG